MNAVAKTAAGKDEQDDWKPVGKARNSYADVVKKREKQLPIKPEGLHASHWKGTVVNLADFTSRVSTAKTGDRCDLGCPAVADENIPPITGFVSAYTAAEVWWEFRKW